MTRETKDAINRLQDAKDGYKEYLTDEALDMAIKALSQEPILDKLTEIIEPLRHLAFDEMSDVEWQILQVIDKYAEQEPCETCGYAEGSPLCLQYCPYDADRKKEPTEKPMCDRNICISNEYNGIGCDECIVNKPQEPMREFTEEEAKAYSKALDKMYKPTGFNVFNEPCDDAISRQAALKFTCDDCKHSDSCVNAQNGYKYPNCAYSLRQLPPVTHKSGKWIPVSEGLPEESGDYLVCGRGKVWICEMLSLYAIRGFCNDVKNPIVEAWMPLPEPYKTESEE